MISVADAALLAKLSDPTILCLINNCTWCFTMWQASEVARERRRRA
jgi:hypothetical protein